MHLEHVRRELGDVRLQHLLERCCNLDLDNDCFYNELKLALVNEQRSREDANRRADESHELLVQAKNQLKSQQQKTTQLLQSGKEKVREALEIEWADFMAEYQEESAAKLVKAEKKFETQKKENKKLKKQVRRLMCDYQ